MIKDVNLTEPLLFLGSPPWYVDESAKLAYLLQALFFHSVFSAY